MALALHRCTGDYEPMPSFHNVLIGAGAGVAGSAGMHVFRVIWEGAVSHNSRHAIFGFDREADVNGARLASRIFSSGRLGEPAARHLGIAMHYGLGATFGLLYVLSGAPAISGAALGALLWLLADEIPISATGISNPSQKSPRSHAAALASHLLFGVVVTQTVRALATKRLHPTH
jgi:hypothetical protein